VDCINKIEKIKALADRSAFFLQLVSIQQFILAFTQCLLHLFQFIHFLFRTVLNVRPFKT